MDNSLSILNQILGWSRRKGNCLICYMNLSKQNRPRIMINGVRYNVSKVIMHLLKDFPLNSALPVIHNDNLCKSKACIELNHLRVGTYSENTQDKINKHGNSSEFHGKFNGIKKTHCKRGHERVIKNLTNNGSCKLCMLERQHTNG